MRWARIGLVWIAMAAAGCRTPPSRAVQQQAGLFCIENADCVAGLVCLDVEGDTRICSAACSASNRVCPGNLVCFVPGDVSGWCGRACANDDACPTGFACNPREICAPVACVRAAAPAGCCTTTDDCTPPARCYRMGCEDAGRCLPLRGEECWADSDCRRTGTRCEGAVVHTFECVETITVDEHPGVCVK